MLSKDEVKHIAALARIGVTDKDLEEFSHDLSTILDWVKQLEESDVEGVSPTAHTAGEMNITREDTVEDFSGKGDIVKLFPEEKNGYDKVKSVL